MAFYLYVDEDSESRALLAAVRAQGIQVTSAGEAQMRGKTDGDQLAFATLSGAVLYSGNKGDFSRLHTSAVREGGSHAGVILLHDRRLGIGEQARRLRRIHDAISADDFLNRLEWLSSW